LVFVIHKLADIKDAQDQKDAGDSGPQIRCASNERLAPNHDDKQDVDQVVRDERL
jgi:hypothetical protein